MDRLNPDFITIRIDENLIRDPMRFEMIDTYEVLSQDLPRQMDPDFAEEFTANADRMNEASTTLLGLNILAQLLL